MVKVAQTYEQKFRLNEQMNSECFMSEWSNSPQEQIIQKEDKLKDRNRSYKDKRHRNFKEKQLH